MAFQDHPADIINSLMPALAEIRLSSLPVQKRKKTDQPREQSRISSLEGEELQRVSTTLPQSASQSEAGSIDSGLVVAAQDDPLPPQSPDSEATVSTHEFDSDLETSIDSEYHAKSVLLDKLMVYFR